VAFLTTAQKKIERDEAPFGDEPPKPTEPPK